jgi:hypothetical protein
MEMFTGGLDLNWQSWEVEAITDVSARNVKKGEFFS